MRAAFRHWREQEGAAAPIFTGFQAPTRHRRRATFRLCWLPGLLAAVSLITVLGIVRFKPPQPRPSLAQSLPEPLLKPADTGEFVRLPMNVWSLEPAPSDFLFPQPFTKSSIQIP